MSQQPRTAVVAEERRRRQPGTLDRGQQLKLSVPAEIEAKYPDYVFRWVNDSGNRVHDLTVRDDYDKVDGVDPRPVGTDDLGKPIFAHLCKKKRDFFEHDQREKLQAIKDREEALMRKPDPSADADAGITARAGNSITPGFTP